MGLLAWIRGLRIERIIALYLAFLAGWDSYAYFASGRELPPGFSIFVGFAVGLYLLFAIFLVYLR
ncbi:MAG: hypothetical protein QXS76_00170 [Candidatus Bathyarchaeia archaeon]